MGEVDCVKQILGSCWTTKARKWLSNEKKFFKESWSISPVKINLILYFFIYVLSLNNITILQMEEKIFRTKTAKIEL